MYCEIPPQSTILAPRASLASGDDRYLPARDKGPVRAFARDYVDSRRTVGEYMLPLVIVFLLTRRTTRNVSRSPVDWLLANGMVSR